MAYTTDYNFAKLPAGAVDWMTLLNDLMDKVEAGRTLQKTAAATIAKYQCFYIDSAGKAVIATGSTDAIGIWQSTSTATDTSGFGQIDGTMTYGSWTWTPGTFLYSGASGALTATPSTTRRRVAYALTATKILLLSNFMSTYTASRAMVTDASGNVDISAVTAAELGYVAGVTSALQSQVDAKKTIATGNNYKWETTGSGGLLQETTVTASRAVASDANGLPVAATTTAAELDYVNGVTSAIQTQLNAKAPSAAPNLTGLVKLTPQELTASGAITSSFCGLNHATVIIAATLEAPTAGQLAYIVNTSASGTAAHTVTLPGGVTFDGTNNTATFDAPDEALYMIARSTTRWQVILNVGSVVLSTV